MAILLALGCLICSALNDFLFKLFAGRQGPRGMFITVIGCVWLLALLGMPVEWERDTGTTVLWGMVSGLFSLAANLLLIEAMRRQSAGVCSTIFRLNLVAVVIGACWLLDETLTVFQGCGVVFAVAAVYCFLSWGKGGAGRAVWLGFWLVLVASLLRAGMGLSYKYGFLRGADPNGVVLLNSLFWIAGGIIYSLGRDGASGWKPDWRLLGFGVLSGILVTGIVFFMAAALRCGKASVVLPIAQMSFLGTLGLSAAILKEKLDWRKCAGIGCGMLAILFLSIEG